MTYTKESKVTNSYTNQSNPKKEFLLQEDSDEILMENNEPIQLETSNQDTYTKESKVTNSYANQPKA